MTKLHPSELILNPDGTIYHLNLLPEDIADIIITVGDPERVTNVSKYFDRIEIKKQKREFVTHTGYLHNKRMTVISTGISTANIDIVFNELDALANIDFKERVVKDKLTRLNLIRIGTAGTPHPDIPLNSQVVTEYSIGTDSLAHFYQFLSDENETELQNIFSDHFAENKAINNCYATSGSNKLIDILKKDCQLGITLTCSGFYAPQGRTLRAQPTTDHLIERLTQVKWLNRKITNIEMETAAIYLMGKILNHDCCSVSTILTNRGTKQFSETPQQAVDKLIQSTLEKLAAL